MQELTLAIFDLDHTLLPLDCSAQWAARMQQLGWVAGAQFRARHAALMAEYGERGLDMQAYLQLTLEPLRGRCAQAVAEAVQQLVDEHLLPAVYAQAWRLLQMHREAGHSLLLVSASEDFLVEPMGRALGFTHIFGVPCARQDGCFTGAPGGPATYAEGKVRCVEAWLAGQQARVRRSYFYSDSHNDLPLLHWVSDPRPTNPNARLQAEAQRLGWPCLWLDPQQAASA